MWQTTNYQNFLQLQKHYRKRYFLFLVPPLILQKDDNADIVAREGDNITLSCDATGHPRPQIVWRREDKEDILVNGRKGSQILYSRCKTMVILFIFEEVFFFINNNSNNRYV